MDERKGFKDSDKSHLEIFDKSFLVTAYNLLAAINTEKNRTPIKNVIDQKVKHCYRSQQVRRD